MKASDFLDYANRLRRDPLWLEAVLRTECCLGRHCVEFAASEIGDPERQWLEKRGFRLIDDVRANGMATVIVSWGP